MKRLSLALSLALLATGPLAAAQDNPNPNPGGDGQGSGGGVGPAGTGTLLFTTTGNGWESTLSGIGVLMSELRRRDVGVITPGAFASAETFLCHQNYNLMHGDKDADGIWFDAMLGGAIDAITVCGDSTWPKYPRFPNVFISVKANVGVPGLTAVMTPGDVASPRLGGAYSYLITEQQIRTAFDVLMGEPVDVDAVEKANDGTLYLSLEDDVWIRGGAVLALDGDMLMIAAADLVYNGCQVTNVVPASGTIAVYEAQWDNMVMMSGVADSAGAPVVAIGDLDGLAFENAGGATWMSQGLDGVVTLPHFLFCGETTDGAAVLSTQAVGSIAVMNGQPLATAAPMPTTGTQMGLLPGSAPTVRSLGGLCLLDHESSRVVLDINPALPVPGDVITIEWSGCDPFAATSLVLQVGVAAVGGSVPGVAVPNPGFAFWFGGAMPAFLPFMADANGVVSFAYAYGGGIPAGVWVSLQPITKQAAYAAVTMGGPALMQF